MKGLLITTLLLSVHLAFADVQSQTETQQNIDLQTQFKSSQSDSLTLIENLLSGMDFRLQDAVIPSQTNITSTESYYVTLDLVVTDQYNQQSTISLFTSDDFSAGDGYVAISKEFYVSGFEMFKALEPNLYEIESSSKIHLSVNLHKSNLALTDGRKLGEAISHEDQSAIYSTQVSFQESKMGFKQDIDLPETFSHIDNSEITDLGFGLFFR